MLFFRKKEQNLYLALEKHSNIELQRLPGDEELQKISFSAAFEAKMKKLFAEYRRHRIANRRALVALAACVALVLGVSAIPYPGQNLSTIPYTQPERRTKVYDQIDQYRQNTKGANIKDHTKETPAYDSLSGNTSGVTPTLAMVVAEAQLGVYGRVVAKEYVFMQYIGNDLQVLVSEDSQQLPQVNCIRYKLQVYYTFIGSLGWRRSIYVYVSGDGTQGISQKLKTGNKALFLLQKGQLTADTVGYFPVLEEHGSFKVTKGELYAFSNVQSTSAYDGKSVWRLISDVQKLRKKMELK